VIELPRSLAGKFLAVVRRCFRGTAGSLMPLVLARTGAGGLVLEAVGHQVAVRLAVPEPSSEAVLAFRCEVLATVAGKGDDPVTLREARPGQGCGSWFSDGRGREQEFGVYDPTGLLPFPPLPEQLPLQQGDFLTALAEAHRSTAKEHGRLPLRNVLLSGRTGQIVATDGKQLLVQSGFSFPWSDDVLIEHLDVWGSRELRGTGPVAVGRQESHVFVTLGPWTFALKSEPSGRFPKWPEIIPKAKEVLTRVRFSPDDVRTLIAKLPDLPGRESEYQPIRLRLGKTAVVVAQGSHAEDITELVLTASQVEGFELTVATDRRYLLRALKLGLTELEVVRPDRPLCCRDAGRTYLWMPLSAEDAVPNHCPSVTPSKESAMTNTNGVATHGNGDAAQQPDTPPDPMTEAEAVRSLLQEAQSRLGRLMVALKHHRRQAKAVQAAVASLRQLPTLAP
jgi:hypothetical protein